jgi:hypothetical protein
MSSCPLSSTLISSLSPLSQGSFLRLMEDGSLPQWLPHLQDITHSWFWTFHRSTVCLSLWIVPAWCHPYSHIAPRTIALGVRKAPSFVHRMKWSLWYPPSPPPHSSYPRHLIQPQAAGNTYLFDLLTPRSAKKKKQKQKQKEKTQLLNTR